MEKLTVHDFTLFFLQIGVMLTVALAFGQLMRRLHQPAVLGELIGGILLGPTLVGLVFPEFYTWLFVANPQVTLARQAVIQIGMLFFMFIAGLEINLARLGQRKGSVIFTSLFGCILPFGLGFAAVLLFPDLWGHSFQDNLLPLALFMGTALSISALPVITRILMDLQLIHHALSPIVLTAAIINDLIGWSLFAVLLSQLNSAGPQTSLGLILGRVFFFVSLILILGHWVGRPFLKWVRRSLIWPGGFMGVIIVFILLAASLAEAFGVHAIFGAFLVGVALYHVFQGDDEDRVREIIYQFAISFFAPLYFVSVGLRVDFASHFDLQLAVLVTLLATVGKVVGAGLGARLGGSGYRESLAIGFAMNARGAMEMILASVALDYGLIDQRLFVALITMALVTSMLSGPMLQWTLGLPNVFKAQHPK